MLQYTYVTMEDLCIKILHAFQGRRLISWQDPRPAGAAEERGGRLDVSVVIIVVSAAGQNVKRQRQEEVLTLQGGTGYVIECFFLQRNIILR